MAGSKCQACKGLDLSYYYSIGSGFLSPDPELRFLPPETNLGTIEDVRSRAECHLCSLVFALLKSNPQTPSHTRDIILRPWEFGIEVYMFAQHQLKGHRQSHNSFVLQGELTVHANAKIAPPVGSGAREISGKVLRNLLHICENKHGEDCAGSRYPIKEKTPFTPLLIDVEQRCLVSLDPTQERRYIALSYVWGKVKMLQTKMDNLPHLMQPNSLYEFQDQLPMVVIDAMQVVCMLGERYLWVDSLCIVQDDPTSKHRQTSQMDVIYSHSLLTIVAASGRDASEGLPGIGSTPRLPVAIHTQNVALTRYSQGLHLLLEDAVYERRAWTLQEKMLSRRCLVFTAEQVFFRCNMALHPECEPEPLVKVTAEATVRTTNFVNPFSRFATASGSHFLQNSETGWHAYFQHYTFIVKDYSNRQLSFPSDILVAFEGLGSAISLAIGGEFYCGLPERLFDRSLLWFRSSRTNLVRRTGLIHVPGGEDIIAPSWSWAGWQGCVENLVAVGNYQHKHNQLVTDCQILTPEGFHAIGKCSDPTTSPRPMFKRIPTLLSLINPYLKNGTPFPTHVLNFTTSTVLDPFSTFDLESVTGLTTDQLDRIPWRSWLLDHHHNRCGVFFEHLPPEILTTRAHPPKFGLMAISSCHLSSQLNTLTWGGPWASNETAQTMVGESYKLDSILSKGRDDETHSGICVLLVEWIVDSATNCEWAERVALGVVHADAWEAMGAERREVWLA